MAENRKRKFVQMQIERDIHPAVVDVAYSLRVSYRDVVSRAIRAAVASGSLEELVRAGAKREAAE